MQAKGQPCKQFLRLGLLCYLQHAGPPRECSLYGKGYCLLFWVWDPKWKRRDFLNKLISLTYACDMMETLNGSARSWPTGGLNDASGWEKLLTKYPQTQKNNARHSRKSCKQGDPSELGKPEVPYIRVFLEQWWGLMRPRCPENERTFFIFSPTHTSPCRNPGKERSTQLGLWDWGS